MALDRSHVFSRAVPGACRGHRSDHGRTTGTSRRCVPFRTRRPDIWSNEGGDGSEHTSPPRRRAPVTPPCRMQRAYRRAIRPTACRAA